MATRISDDAQVAGDVTIGDGTQVWNLVQIRERAEIGVECVIGRGAYIGIGVRVGDRCKIQNNALVYDPAVIGDGVFIGPGAILTNDRLPRAISPSGDLKRADDWDPVGVTIETGASIGAGAVCVAPVRIGAWAMVAAGSVVVRDIPDHALVAGNPARQIGWVDRDGQRMVDDGGVLVDASTGSRFVEVDGCLVEQS
jgi:UDP-2-acetamido-3-amino-2,3-dideoxy-glucuronate N-acetyltransferase